MKKKFSTMLVLFWVSFTGISQVTDGLTAYYSLKQSTVDSSGNGYDATLAGNAGINGSLSIPYDDISYLSIPNAVMNQLQDFSVAMWVKFNQFHTGSGSHYNTMLSGENSLKSGGDNVGFYYQKFISGPGGQWQMWLQDDYYIENTDSIVALQWYFVVFVRQGTDAFLYKNGILRASAANVYASALLIEPNGLMAGQEQDVVGSDFSINQCLDGNIGKLRIYDRALTQSEVTILSNNPVGIEPHLSPDLKIYPNPSRGKLVISGLSGATPSIIEIYHSNGALVYSAGLEGSDNNTKASIDFDRCGSGLYFARIKTGGYWYQIKFIVTD
ncbi:MAG: T9SS type A sorting domain-containing protein [Bacteroidales bacterium]|nr:T9SS type A sorting domain-containing protein [Bacteroidales bacterium]